MRLEEPLLSRKSSARQMVSRFYGEALLRVGLQEESNAAEPPKEKSGQLNEDDGNAPESTKKPSYERSATSY